MRGVLFVCHHIPLEGVLESSQMLSVVDLTSKAKVSPIVSGLESPVAIGFIGDPLCIER